MPPWIPGKLPPLVLIFLLLCVQTGTLTENQMTVVDGWFADKFVRGAELKNAEFLSPSTLDLMSQNVAINRSCQVRFKDDEVGGAFGLRSRKVSQHSWCFSTSPLG